MFVANVAISSSNEMANLGSLIVSDHSHPKSQVFKEEEKKQEEEKKDEKEEEYYEKKSSKVKAWTSWRQ